LTLPDLRGILPRLVDVGAVALPALRRLAGSRGCRPWWEDDVLLTLRNYERVLAGLIDRGRHSVTIADFITVAPSDGFSILRHDVEWDVRRALVMARREAALGHFATYYFHGPHRPRVFDIDTMNEIQALGHEVGYHYETLDRAGGDQGLARELFQQDVARFRDAGINLRTVAPHGNPRISKVTYEHNGVLLDRDPSIVSSSGLIGDGVRSLRSARLEYVTDTGARFSTISGDVLAYITAVERRRLYLLTHPDYWSQLAVRAVTLRATGSAMRSARPVARAVWMIKDRASR
jgi:hypothetical protein